MPRRRKGAAPPKRCRAAEKVPRRRKGAAPPKRCRAAEKVPRRRKGAAPPKRCRAAEKVPRRRKGAAPPKRCRAAEKVPRRRKSEYGCIKRRTRSFGGAFSFFDREVVAMKPLMDKQKSSCVVMKQNQAGHPLVSVVVPVYNVEEYLEDMLRSVLRQSLTQLEVICVNDGSTDASLDVLMRWAAEEPRISVLSQENAGLSAARNRGLDAAAGEYAIFLDAGDRLLPDSLRRLYDAAVKNKLDLVKGAVRLKGARRGETELPAPWSHRDCPKLWTAATFAEAPRELLETAVSFYGLYRTEFVRQSGLAFSPLPDGGERSFSVGCLTAAQRLMITDIPVAERRVAETGSPSFERQIVSYAAIRELAATLPQATARLVCQWGLNRVFEEYFRRLERGKDVYALHERIKEFVWCLDADDVGEDFIAAFAYKEHFWTLKNLCLPPRFEGRHGIATEARPLVTIVMPVFNAQRYLCEAVESALRQSLTSFELLCVDDGSTDDTPNVLREYAARDGRIVVTTQEHAGVGVARNLALDAARGEYVTFLDSDDAFDADYLLKMTDRARSTRADVVVGGTYRWQGGEAATAEPSSLRLNLLPRDLPVFCWRDVPQYIFNFCDGGPGGKLFRRDFIDSLRLRFPALPRAEDIVFVYAALGEASRIIAYDTPGYRRRVNNPRSLEHTKDESPLAFWEATKLWKRNLAASECWPQVKQSFINSTLDRCAYNLRMVGTLDSVFRILRELRTQANELMELDRRDRGYFYNPSNLDYVTRLLQYEDESEYLFARCRRLDGLELQLRNVNARCAKLEKDRSLAAQEASRRQAAEKELSSARSQLQKETSQRQTAEKELSSARSQLQKETSQRQTAEREAETARNQLRIKENVMHDLQRSVSFRLGRVLTWVPRKARGGVRCWRDHGLAHILRWALWHLGLKK
ncbi:glycosyltransferase [Pyramidobacter piscolens]|uniref:glycosyltransferase n=1 Tax=Pyramidobacter piscolens TaxID=638849 RepID=UPI002AB1022F|nr:glycosyltransferase [Pyramidobacter piscolens]